MEENRTDDLQGEAIKHADNAASAALAGYAEFLNQYEELTKQGVDSRLATIESLKSQHRAEAQRYRWLAEQAEAAGDLKSAAILSREAEANGRLVVTLSQELSSSHQTLKAYAEAREADLLVKTGGSKAAQALLKRSGAIGNTAALIAALNSGNDAEVTKAVASMAVGGVAGTTLGFFTGMLFPPLAPAVAAAVSLAVSEIVPQLLTEEQWASLTEFAKEAISVATKPLEPFWQAFLRSFGGDLEDIAKAANDKFLSALNLIRRIDPLVLDLDGDGIETLGADAGVLFDFDGDGVKTGTGWIKGDDGFLVLDRNGNGLIDSGQELFGVDTVKRDGTKARNGFDALADLDSNGDGLFDADDEMFSQVRVWQDFNKDGIAQSNELKTLAEHRISAIVLKSKEANEDSNGNLISATGTFIRDDGSEGEVNGNQSLAADVDLESNPFYSEHTNPVEVDDGVLKLPSLQGSGMVRELREAATLSPELRALLGAYAASGSHREQRDLLDRLIAAWAATGEGYRPFEQRIDALDRNGVDFRFAFSWETSGKQPTEAQALLRDRLARLNILESFNGQPFLEFTVESMSSTFARVKIRIGANTTTRTVAIRNGVAVLTESDLPMWNDVLSLLDASYRELLGSVQSGLLLQTRLKEYADVVDIAMNGEVVALDFDRLFQRLNEVAVRDPVKGVMDGVDLLRSLKSLDAGKLSPLIESLILSLSPEQLALMETELTGEGHIIFDTAASSSINAGNGNDLVLGLAGNDKLYAQDGNDFLWGHEGNDSLYGGNGSDVLVGGTGNDRLEGGTGSDTYIFGRGDGVDTIYNKDTSAGRWDVLQFRESVEPGDVYARRGNLNQLYLYIRGTSDRVTIEEYFYAESRRLNDIRFADGTSWSYEQIKAMVLASTDNDDTLYGYASDDEITGGLGKDVLYGSGGNDRLDGGEGDDKLYGGDGNDVLTGGSGNDRLEGGAGSDTYIFGRGDGTDTIYNKDTSAGRLDVLQFRDGVEPGDVYARRGSLNQLHLYIRGTNDRVTIEEYFYAESHRLNDIRFADGTSWSYEQIKAMVLASSDGDDTLYGYASDDVISGGLGKDILYGNGGNDRLDGGSGDDKLYGGDGNDVLTGGTGNDRLEGGAGSDTYIFGRGDGVDTIYNKDTSAGRWDVLQFREGIEPGDVYARRGSLNQLHLYIRGTNDRVTIEEYFYAESHRLNDIRFADGTSWSYEQIKAMVLTSSDNDDTLYGYASDDEITGGLGKDILYGNGGNDRLDGGEGDDKLYGGDGNDVLEGGIGQDRLEGGSGDDVLHTGTGGGWLTGGAGSDTYLFGHGDGLVTVNNNDRSQGRRDVLQFLEGVSVGDVTIERVNNDLYLYLKERTDRIRVADYFRGADYRVDAVHFDDGTEWSYEYIQDHLTSTSGRASAAPASDSAATSTIEHDLNALVSAMASVTSAGDAANPVTPPVQQHQPSWASMAV
ncbi:calcium-binding protein [Luteibacter jiangsuensis]